MTTAAVCLVAVCAAGPARAATLTDGGSYGPWNVVFAGYGTVTATSSKLTLRPATATAADQTHAALVVGQPQTDVRLKARVTLNAQLRTGPNPWETGWVVTRYTDPDHFYYVALKTNGWELGKRDPAYPGGQRFLATGDAPAASVGGSQQVVLTASGAKLTVRIDGEPVATFVDSQRPYRSGAVGFYSEDADVTFDKISVTAL